ncbi:MAG: glycosyltransferase family 4 protein [Candidatus Omnitrophica bacterium]|nr:glycosyltransferase family 4 protein [Candidatus Omnitrophota bacterium]
MPDKTLGERESGKRVLFIGNFIKASPIKSPYEDLLSRLSSRGWRVSRASVFKTRWIRALSMACAIVFSRGAYDKAVILVYSGRAFYWAEAAGFLLRVLRKPYVAALHGGDLPAFAGHFEKKFKRFLIQAERVICPSYHLRDSLSCPGIEIEYLPNGIDLKKFFFHSRRSPRPRLCWVRAFHKIYDPQTALTTLALILQDFPEAVLTMAGPDTGDGTFRKVLQTIRELGLEKAVRLCGGIPNAKLPELFQEHDIFLNTTTLESFGVSVMEAAASGLCIVSSNAGEIPRIWEAGKNALLFNPGDPKGAAEAVKQLLCQPELAVRFSREARVNAERFGWDSILPEWEKILLTGKEGMER